VREAPLVPSTAYVFGDESGTCQIRSELRHFVIATVSTHDRFLGSQLDRLARALGHGEFHARKDNPSTQRKVCAFLGGQPVAVDITVVDKRQLPRVTQGGLRLYSEVVASHFARVLGFLDPVLQVEFVMASIGSDLNKQRTFEGSVRRASEAAAAAIGALGALDSRPLGKLVLDAGQIRVPTMPLPARNDRCVQAADYCAWAALRKWEGHGDDHYRLISRLIRSEVSLQFGVQRGPSDAA
jgi:hypothetical protein